MLNVLITAACIFVFIACVYTIYKIAWYTVKMLALKKALNSLNSNNVSVSFERKFSKAVFGKKGEVDFVVASPKGKYEVSIISFISVHSRWNFSSANGDQFVEVRRRNNIFYRLDNNSHSPDHAKEYRRESSFATAKLNLSAPREDCARHILLIYPKPRELTHTHVRFDHLSTGSKLDGWEIMHANDFFELLGDI